MQPYMPDLFCPSYVCIDSPSGAAEVFHWMVRGVCRGPLRPTLYGSGSTIAMPRLPLPVGNGLPGTGVSAPVVELIAKP